MQSTKCSSSITKINFQSKKGKKDQATLDVIPSAHFTHRPPFFFFFWNLKLLYPTRSWSYYKHPLMVKSAYHHPATKRLLKKKKKKKDSNFRKKQWSTLTLSTLSCIFPHQHNAQSPFWDTFDQREQKCPHRTSLFRPKKWKWDDEIKGDKRLRRRNQREDAFSKFRVYFFFFFALCWHVEWLEVFPGEWFTSMSVFCWNIGIQAQKKKKGEQVTEEQKEQTKIAQRKFNFWPRRWSEKHTCFAWRFWSIKEKEKKTTMFRVQLNPEIKTGLHLLWVNREKVNHTFNSFPFPFLTNENQAKLTQFLQTIHF